MKNLGRPKQILWDMLLVLPGSKGFSWFLSIYILHHDSFLSLHAHNAPMSLTSCWTFSNCFIWGDTANQVADLHNQQRSTLLA